MCDFENGFILCSCNEESNETTLNSDKETYVWELKTLKETIPARGITQFPISDIGMGLNAEWVLLNLIDRNCFDFDYQPLEGDNLIMYSNNSANDKASFSNQPAYLSYIYRNEEWVEDFYMKVGQLTQLKNKGKIKPV